NSYGGIWLISSSYNTVSSNNISNHIFGGIYLSKSSNNQINANIGSNNGPVDFVGGIFVGDIILVMNSNNNNVSSNNVSKSNFGIMLAESSNYNTVSGNIVSNSKGGIVTFLVSNNILSGNTVLDNNLGIWVYQSSNNMVKNNTVLNSRTYGIGVSSSNNMESCCNNIIYNNNLINNPTQAIVYTDNNIFNLEAPIGGNYYSDYDTPEEGCNNINGDNFCDEPYVFSSGWDNLPWISPDGWLPRGNTPVGSNVQINPDAHVSILYNEVTTAGDTTVTQSTTNPGPDKDDFMFLGNYYELSTSAVFTPPVTVCINYDDIACRWREKRISRYSTGVRVEQAGMM
ncbi:MAG: surface layer protein B, partial [Candidatus Methanoperedens nitroreducens]